MPSESKAEHRFMGFMMSHPDEAKRRGIDPAMAAEFVHADKGKVGKLPERAKAKPAKRKHVYGAL